MMHIVKLWNLEKEKQNRLESVEGKLNTMQSMIEKLALAITRTADQEQQTELVNSIYESGWLKSSKVDSDSK
jgi:hypothetical protein